jgi:hypothetical protein
VLARGRLIRSGPLEAMLAERSQVVIATGLLPLASCRSWNREPGVWVTASKWSSSVRPARKAEVLRRLLDAGVEIRRLRRSGPPWKDLSGATAR